jgi:predicted DNA-binding protein (UPF0251 family)
MFIMVRPKKRRFVVGEPEVTYFKPRGVQLRKLEETGLTVEELEAIRLKDLEMLDQERCSREMKVSRPTFQRILISARKKIADAVVSGKALRIGGGDYMVGTGKGGRGMGGGFGLGPGGECVCPECKLSVPHKRGVPCYGMKCPKCGKPMTRAR